MATVGILLNPNTHRHPYLLPTSSYPPRSQHHHHPSTQSLSSTSSSDDVTTPASSDNATLPRSLTNSLSLPYVSDDDHLSRPITGSSQYPPSTKRSVRFAPLPDPRRAVLVTENGEELPLPSVFDDGDRYIISSRSFLAQPSPSLLLGGSVVAPKQHAAIIASDLSSSRLPSLLPSPTYTKNTAVTSPPSSSTLRSRRFLPSFWSKSADLRSRSRDSSSSPDGSPLSFGLPLSQWMSADAGSRRGSSSSTNGPPLARVQSAFSVPPKPKRLLNGRVYGAQKPPRNLSTNAFGNAPDEEPEFVEWGHGGMGSVRAGGMWAKVQSNQKLLIGHTEERGRRGIPAVSHVDEDDGGGMGWVKRRREERERNKLEEQAAGEATSNTNGVATSSPSSDATSPPSSTLVSVDRNVTTVTPSQLTPEEDDDSEDEEETVDDESSCTEQEDDDDSQEQHFKQVLGAGVERVCRHCD